MASSPHLVPKMLPAYAQDADRPYVGDPWSRQIPHETARAYEAFTIFRDMPPNTRSLKAASDIYKTRHGLKENSKNSVCAAFSAKHRWKERVEAWDNFNDAKLVAANRRQLIRSATKHAEQSAAVQDILMRPIDEYRKRLAESGMDVVALMSDEQVMKLAVAFGRELPAQQKSEREALSSTSATVVTPREIRSKGEIVRKILADPTMIGLMEKVSFETVETLADADDSGTG